MIIQCLHFQSSPLWSIFNLTDGQSFNASAKSYRVKTSSYFGASKSFNNIEFANKFLKNENEILFLFIVDPYLRIGWRCLVLAKNVFKNMMDSLF